MKILVTGGLGYIGSHTVVELINSGNKVIIVDNLVKSNLNVLKSIEKITGFLPEFEQFDITNSEKTADFFNRNNDIIGIIHFAAYKYVGESVENPILYYQNNLISLINILDEMKKHNIKNIVFSSSCTVYGQPDISPVNENSPVKPAVSPYGNTKQISEEIIRDCTNSYPIKAISLRYFNPIGAHESALIGQLPEDITQNLVPYITEVAIGSKNQLNVFGNDYNTPDGTCIRDYIHVVDLAKAHVASVARMLDNKGKSNYEIFNIGTGIGYSVMEIIKTFEKVSGIKLNYIIKNRRPGDAEKIWADTSLAKKELKWEAEKSLTDMVGSAWKWQQYLDKINYY